MRIAHCLLVLFASASAGVPLFLASPPARADTTTIYRCESADGISLQSRPCPKGVKQTKRTVERPVEPAPVLPSAQSNTIATRQAASPAPPSIPVTAAADMRGPNEPYQLWQCMRADGSTFESRNGVPGRQWVVQTTDADPGVTSNSDDTDAPAQITAPAAKPSPQTGASTAADPNAPPVGAAPGAWVPDQCTRLEPEQACERFVVRRDALRKQIYAAKPSERIKYAPEEQDLTSMLYAACGH